MKKEKKKMKRTRSDWQMLPCTESVTLLSFKKKIRKVGGVGINFYARWAYNHANGISGIWYML